jgi:phenylpropionate dioxygenase-like ring-hydroxylating dioxygenase large terminal subunit
MDAIVIPEHYCSREILDKEIKNIFHKVWSFVCLKSELANDNDFVTKNIGNTSIVVQNIRGEIKAFLNVCSHRHSRIQCEQKGNRPLICPYHGWSYNKEGIPTGIPKKPYFDFQKDDLEKLKLKEIKIDFCGQIVFINSNDDSEDLKEYLGDFYEELEKMSNNMGQEVDVNEMKINANWKILVENTLESYHVALIHTDTFLRLGTQGIDFSFSGNNSVWTTPLAKSENEGKNSIIHKPFQDREYKIDGYKHYIIFPNLLVSTTYGISFNISLIDPIDENYSQFISRVFVTKTDTNIENIPLVEAYNKNLVQFNRDVFSEDKEICEAVQLGVQSSPYSGQLSKEEKRVWHFQNSVMNLLKDK